MIDAILSCPHDVVVVGAGLTGATVARLLADQGKRVIVVERRLEIGGNCSDRVHKSGIRICDHGPHYFRTNSADVWDFVQRFAGWRPYTAYVKALVGHHLEPWPITRDTIEGNGWHMPSRHSPIGELEPANFEQACVRRVGREAYEKFIKGYTEKQWGVPATELSPSLAVRIDLREGGDQRLKLSKHQALPLGGYTDMITRMLAGIQVHLGVDGSWLCSKHRDGTLSMNLNRPVVYTGPIDALFQYVRGCLRYRGQHRNHTYVQEDHAQPYLDPKTPGLWCFQQAAQVNYPDPSTPYIRSIEWKRMMEPGAASAVRGTVITYEYPVNGTHPDDREYPFPDAANQAMYRDYRTIADKFPTLTLCGRLGRYQYIDMDQAIAQGMTVASQLLARGIV